MLKTVKPIRVHMLMFVTQHQLPILATQLSFTIKILTILDLFIWDTTHLICAQNIIESSLYVYIVYRIQILLYNRDIAFHGKASMYFILHLH